MLLRRRGLRGGRCINFPATSGESRAAVPGRRRGSRSRSPRGPPRRARAPRHRRRAAGTLRDPRRRQAQEVLCTRARRAARRGARADGAAAAARRQGLGGEALSEIDYARFLSVCRWKVDRAANMLRADLEWLAHARPRVPAEEEQQAAGPEGGAAGARAWQGDVGRRRQRLARHRAADEAARYAGDAGDDARVPTQRGVGAAVGADRGEQEAHPLHGRGVHPPAARQGARRRRLGDPARHDQIQGLEPDPVRQRRHHALPEELSVPVGRRRRVQPPRLLPARMADRSRRGSTRTSNRRSSSRPATSTTPTP